MKKNLITIILIGGIILCPIIKAANVFALTNLTSHINKNGIEVSDKEYKFINDFYGEGFFNNMTKEEYDWIRDLNLENSKVSINRYYEHSTTITPYSTVHRTTNKELTIASSCTTICTIVIKAEWITNPGIRSYDLIGARFKNVSLASSNIQTKVSSSNGIEYFNNTKVFANGLGTSVKLPTSASNIKVEQKFYTTAGGTVFGSYQHAIKNISLLTSQSYVIDISGIGGVFRLTGDAIGSFDQMAGVSINA